MTKVRDQDYSRGCYNESVVKWMTLCVLIAVETESISDKDKPPVPSFAPSKWETVDESELEAQGDVCIVVVHCATGIMVAFFFDA